VLGATALKVTWTEPINPNGLLISYTVRLPQPRYDVNASVTSLDVDQLDPYMLYNVTLTACSGNQTIVYSKLCPGCDEYSLVFIVEQNLVGILTVMLVRWRRNRGFRQFNEPGPRATGGLESGAKKFYARKEYATSEKLTSK